MLNSDAWLRRMPRALDLEQRLLLDGLLTAADLSCLAFERIKIAVTQLEKSGVDAGMKRQENLDLALNVWALVDSLHNFRSFARGIKRRDGGEFDTFLKDSETAKKLRDRMDHRADNLKNASQKKGSAEPTYGTLSFVSPATGEGFFVHQISLGSMQHEAHVFPIIDTHAQPKNEVSQIRLTAFGLDLDLSEMVERLERCIEAIDSELEEQIGTQIRDFALANGLDPDALLKQTVGAQIWFKLSLRQVKGPESSETSA